MKNYSYLCKIYLQALLFVCFLGIYSLDSEARKPANFVPDDDIIVVPVVIEKNMLDKFNDKHAKKFRSARKKLEYWIAQEEYAENYGLKGTGIVELPTEEEKQRFLNKNYLRFISKDVEKGTNSTLKSTFERWTADDEIDAITAIEMHEKVLIKAQKNQGKPILKKSQTLKVGKERFRFIFQPRVEIGMLKFVIDSKYFKARAWVGVNGNQELKIEKHFQSTRTRAFVNYYIDQTRLLAAVDQRIGNYWGLRLTHSKDFDKFEQVMSSGALEDNIVQVRFHLGF